MVLPPGSFDRKAVLSANRLLQSGVLPVEEAARQFELALAPVRPKPKAAPKGKSAPNPKSKTSKPEAKTKVQRKSKSSKATSSHGPVAPLVQDRCLNHLNLSLEVVVAIVDCAQLVHR